MNWLKNLFKSESENTLIVPKINADTEPDKPLSFGYKSAWYAIKGETPENVIRKLDLVKNCESNWKFGLKYAHDYKNKNAVFVSPQIDGYVLVIGSGLFDLVEIDELEEVEFHAALFEELQFFATHSVSECHVWAKFNKKNCKNDRCYAYFGDNGTIPWNYGKLTEEELALGFDKFPQSIDELEANLEAEFEFEELFFPDEFNVLQIAKAWGVDTSFEGKDYEKSTGFICHCKWVER
jgi:hypothetical protein